MRLAIYSPITSIKSWSSRFSSTGSTISSATSTLSSKFYARWKESPLEMSRFNTVFFLSKKTIIVIIFPGTPETPLIFLFIYLQTLSGPCSEFTVANLWNRPRNLLSQSMSRCAP